MHREGSRRADPRPRNGRRAGARLCGGHAWIFDPADDTVFEPLTGLWYPEAEWTSALTAVAAEAAGGGARCDFELVVWWRGGRVDR